MTLYLGQAKSRPTPVTKRMTDQKQLEALDHPPLLSEFPCIERFVKLLTEVARAVCGIERRHSLAFRFRQLLEAPKARRQ